MYKTAFIFQFHHMRSREVQTIMGPSTTEVQIILSVAFLRSVKYMASYVLT